MDQRFMLEGGGTTIGSQSRTSLAALDINTGSATSWNPAAGYLDGQVYAILASGNKVYVGGSFSQIATLTRNNLAAIDATTGLVTTWDPDVNGRVMALGIHNNNLYVGGFYTEIGSNYYVNLAAIDINTGLPATSGQVSNAGPGEVSTLSINGNILYIGGEFNVVGLNQHEN